MFNNKTSFTIYFVRLIKPNMFAYVLSYAACVISELL